jgi:hypothetical protein
MAEASHRRATRGKDDEVAHSAQRHDALSRRVETDRSGDYGALLNGRRAGPQPVQRVAAPTRPVVQRMENGSDDEEKGSGRKDRRPKERTKVRGGHKGEHALPMRMQQDPKYAQWYHQLKQKNPGFLQKILGQQISASYNLDSKGERLLWPYWQKEKEQNEKLRLQRDSKKKKDKGQDSSDSAESSSDSGSESDSDSEELDPMEEAIGELQSAAVLVSETSGAEKPGKKLKKLADAFFGDYGQSQAAMNKYRLIKAMWDIDDKFMAKR